MIKFPFLFETARLLAGFIVNPSVATDRLLKEKDGILAGFWCVLLYSLLLSLISLLYYFTGMTTPLRSFIAVSPGNLYLLQAFTSIPAVFSEVLAYSALSSLLAGIMGGKGSFEKAFSSQAYALLTPSFIFILIPKLFFVRLSWLPEILFFFIIPELWIMVLSIIVLARAFKMDILRSAAVFFISSLPFLVISAVFIR